MKGGELCDSAKKGKVCIDDLCRGADVTLCGFDKEAYEELLDEDEECTCDIDGQDNCPSHYPIDDGSNDEE